jgi:hypothetical protein
MTAETIQAVRSGVMVLTLAIPLPLRAQDPPDSTSFRSFTPVLWVADVRRSADYFHTVLEFRVLNYAVGSAKIVTELSPSDPEPYAATIFAGDHRFDLLRDGGGDHASLGIRFVIAVENPSAYARRLLKRGVSLHIVAGDSTSAAWFWLMTPDGHHFEFVPYRKPR